MSQQKREFGIRLALGALERNVLTHVLRHGVILTAIGIVIGIGGVFAASRLLDRFLFDVSPLDPITIGSVCVLLSAISMAAMLFPARRASSADPVDVLRSD
jgi:ABC-type antimicrobial peptide transport system permease subunit